MNKLSFRWRYRTALSQTYTIAPDAFQFPAVNYSHTGVFFLQVDVDGQLSFYPPRPHIG